MSSRRCCLGSFSRPCECVFESHSGIPFRPESGYDDVSPLFLVILWLGECQWLSCRSVCGAVLCTTEMWIEKKLEPLAREKADVHIPLCQLIVERKQ